MTQIFDFPTGPASLPKQVLQQAVAEIRQMGRATDGVTLIAVEDGTQLSGLQRVVESDVDEVELETAPE